MPSDVQAHSSASSVGRITVRRALASDIQLVSDILQDAAEWLRDRGIPLWTDEELAVERLAPDIAAGQFYLGEWDGKPAATLRFQLTDAEVWPDLDSGDSAFIHRFAVRRPFAGKGVSLAMLSWSAEKARECGRSYLRLDCEAHRPRLREFYERAGFTYHSDIMVGTFELARYERRL